jgi:hypothetical protein
MTGRRCRIGILKRNGGVLVRSSNVTIDDSHRSDDGGVGRSNYLGNIGGGGGAVLVTEFRLLR